MPWIGPALLQQGDSPPPCPPEYPNVAFDGGTTPIGDPVTCGTCSCGIEPCNVAGASLETFTSLDCTGTTHDMRSFTAGMCVDFSDVHQTVRFLGVPATVGEPWGPSPTAVTNTPPAGLTDLQQVCAPAPVDGGTDGGGGNAKSCGTDGTCAPLPASVTASVICAYAPGNGLECPEGLKGGIRLQIATDTKDDRGCSTCGCAPAAGSCDSKSALYEAAGCGAPVFTNLDPQTRASDPRGTNLRSFRTDITRSPCAPTGGMPMGAVVKADVFTVCCY